MRGLTQRCKGKLILKRIARMITNCTGTVGTDSPSRPSANPNAHRLNGKSRYRQYTHRPARRVGPSLPPHGRAPLRRSPFQSPTGTTQAGTVAPSRPLLNFEGFANPSRALNRIRTLIPSPSPWGEGTAAATVQNIKANRSCHNLLLNGWGKSLQAVRRRNPIRFRPIRKFNATDTPIGRLGEPAPPTKARVPHLCKSVFIRG